MDGSPFFINSAAFFYFRIPRDLWESLLDRYRELGINTLDIYIPWNWHEPSEGEFDFDGHSNPRRDLRGLLHLIAERGFRLIARPGPQILNEWRNGGYPDWLLERSEYHMDTADRLEGRYPPFSNLNTRDSEAEAEMLLANPVHMRYAREWLTTVAKELSPFSSRRVLQVPPPVHSPSAIISVEQGGPLLFVQLEDDQAIGRTNTVGPNFWKYLATLRDALESGGIDVPSFINPTDMRVPAAGANLIPPIAVMGQWYMSPQEEEDSGGRELDPEDISEIEYFTEELKAQPKFPPVLIEYQAGWYSPGDDDRPQESAPENTLLSSRLLIANGLRGINYFPLQDTITPAGYSVPWANRFYRWDAALSANGDPQPRARVLMRNGKLLARWGTFLAAAHKRADFGIINPLSAYPQESLESKDVFRVSGEVMRLERLGTLAGLSSELIDPQNEPVEQLLREPILFLPVFEASHPKFWLAPHAQTTLLEYIRRGGTVVTSPGRPEGFILAPLWREPGLTQESMTVRKFGDGQVIELEKDFCAWLDIRKELAENLLQPEVSSAMDVLRSAMETARVRPVIRRIVGARTTGTVLITELASDEGTGILGARTSGSGLLSVTNLSSDTAGETLEILSPRASSRRAAGDGDEQDYIALHISLPPRESELLPLDQPLCSDVQNDHNCSDRVVAAGAELLGEEREGKTLDLDFYAPSRAEIKLALASGPSRITLEETIPEAKWDPQTSRLHFVIPRAASPDFQRQVKVDLPYTPYVAKKPAPRTPLVSFRYRVVNDVGLPLGSGPKFRTFPPLIALLPEAKNEVLFEVQNLQLEKMLGFHASVDGPLHGSAEIWVPPKKSGFFGLRLKNNAGQDSPGSELKSEADGLIHATLEVRAGEEHHKSPIFFIPPPGEGTTRFEYDFDRDGRKEWALENSGLSLVISPESGGSALALVDKSSHTDVIGSAGALRDHFSYAENPPGVSVERAHGRYGLFNRAYKAEWLDENGNSAIRLNYIAPDIFPAGATIEKTVRLTGPGELQATYRIQLLAAARGTELPPQSFVAVNSIPAFAETDASTRFCWAANSNSEAKSEAVGHVAKNEICREFEPGGPQIVLPDDARYLEIRTPSRPTVKLSWDSGRMTIEQKNFSAWLKLQFPQLTPGGAAGDYSLRIRVTSAEPQVTQ